MKIVWKHKAIANVYFHYAYVGEMACGLIIETLGKKRSTFGWQSKLPHYPYGSPSGTAPSLASAKRKVEAEIEEWFERTKS